MAQRLEIETARRRYERLLRSGRYFDHADRTFFDEQTGGFVLVHRGHDAQNLNSEFFLARVYAGEGRPVILQDESGPERTADADIAGEAWEFKQLTEEVTGSQKNRIQEGLRDARKQNAGCVAYHISHAGFDEEAAREGIKNAFWWDKEERLSLVDLVFNDGTRYRYERQDFEEHL